MKNATFDAALEKCNNDNKVYLPEVGNKQVQTNRIRTTSGTRKSKRRTIQQNKTILV